MKTFRIPARRAILTAIPAALAAAAATFALAAPAHAQQAWPSKPVTFILPFSAGGATDFVARTVAEKLQGRIGQPVIVDYKPGANSLIATRYVLQQPADGYTIYVASSGSTQGPLLFPKEHTYDPFTDFVPVGLMVTSPLVVVVNPNVLPVNDMKELIAYAKANPGKINVATTGIGATDHLVGELVAATSGIKMTFLPYKGAAPAIQDVVGGTAHMRIDSIPSSKPFIDAGKLRPLAVAGERTQLMPGIPAVSETVPGVRATGWFVLIAKTGTPQPIIERLNKELNEILRMPDVVARLQGAGLDPKPGTPRDLTTFMRADYDTWREVLRVTGLKVE